MPRKRLPARLWLRPADHDREQTWIILDGGKQYRTGCGPDAREEAERRLVEHIAAKHEPAAQRARHPSQVLIADVLSVYLDEVAPRQACPAKAASRIGRLLDWWGTKLLSDVTPGSCRDYTASRKRGGSRRDLEDLRAAINHHAKRDLHKGYVGVELPAKGQARAHWLTRDEVARLIWACWRHGRAVRLPKGRSSGTIIESEWHDLRHIARFILMGVYTGSRSGTIFTASIHAGPNRSFLDLDHGIFYRLAEGTTATNKRQPPAPIPPRLLAHLRRWRDKGIIAQHAVEWQGLPVKSIKVGWKHAVELSGIQKKIVPHTLRHTAATWLMQQGVGLWEASGYLGMSEQVLKDTYGHHHPDFMRNAAIRIGQNRNAKRTLSLP
ncbi:tyrosine-type recombinase/integrase [Methylobacterium sp. W2]|nr:tyrosine-type recombinase/integrase [Methylobacterium sp. W2]